MKRLFTILLVLCTFIIIFQNVHADALSEYQKELEAIKAEQESNIKKLTGLDKEIAQDLYDITILDGRVTEFTIKLNVLQTKLNDINKKLAEYEEALQNSAQLYNYAEEMYSIRLKVIYEKGIPNMIDILLNSNSITDFFSKMNVLKSILDYDKKLVENMKNQKEYIDSIKNNIEIQKIQIDQLKYDTEKSTKALENARVAKNSKVGKLENEKVELKEKNLKLKKQAAEAKRKIEEEIAKLLIDGSKYTGNFSGKFTWPVPGIYKITAMFYDKEYFKLIGNNHSGFDIGAPEGKPIVAMTNGVVITAGLNAGGYGNYVVIDHGETDGYTYATLYAHASTINVSKGDIVTTGQTIALSGNTGFSTGAHVHVEVIKAKGGQNWVIDGMDYFNPNQAPFEYLAYGRYIPYPFSNSSTYQEKKIALRSKII